MTLTQTRISPTTVTSWNKKKAVVGSVAYRHIDISLSTGWKITVASTSFNIQYTQLWKYCIEKYLKCPNHSYITEKIHTSPCISLFSLHLSLMETTLGSTLTPEMRGRQRKTESKGGGRIREEEEEAYELCASWVWEKRERQKKSVREELCVELSIGLYRLDGERRESRSEAQETVCVCVCKRGTVVSGLISLPGLIRSIYFKCCFNLSNLCRIWPLPSSYLATLPWKTVTVHMDMQWLIHIFINMVTLTHWAEICSNCIWFQALCLKHE